MLVLSDAELEICQRTHHWNEKISVAVLSCTIHGAVVGSMLGLHS